MLNKHKKRVAIICVFVLIITSVLFVTLRQSKSWNGDEISYASSGRNYSRYGLLTSDNGVYRLKDFESSAEVALCTKPQCSHSSKDCFAYNLLYEIQARIVALYGGKLFYITMDYEYDEDKYIFNFFESTIDGSATRKLTSIKGYSNCRELVITQGYAFLSLMVDDETSESSPNTFGKQKGRIAQISLNDGKTWLLPEKAGFSLNIFYIGASDGKLFYYQQYCVETVETLVFGAGLDAWKKYAAEVAEKSRTSVFFIEINNNVEKYVNEYSNIKSTYIYEELLFRMADGLLIRMLSENSDDYSRKVTTLTAINPVTLKIMSERTFDSDFDGYVSFIGNYAEIIKTTGDDSRYTAYRLLTGEIKELPGFLPYRVNHYIDNKILLDLRADDGVGLITHGWIYTEDYWNGDANKINVWKQ